MLCDENIWMPSTSSASSTSVRPVNRRRRLHSACIYVRMSERAATHEVTQRSPSCVSIEGTKRLVPTVLYVQVLYELVQYRVRGYSFTV